MCVLGSYCEQYSRIGCTKARLSADESRISILWNRDLASHAETTLQARQFLVQPNVINVFNINSNIVGCQLLFRGSTAQIVFSFAANFGNELACLRGIFGEIYMLFQKAFPRCKPSPWNSAVYRVSFVYIAQPSLAFCCILSLISIQIYKILNFIIFNTRIYGGNVQRTYSPKSPSKCQMLDALGDCIMNSTLCT